MLLGIMVVVGLVVALLVRWAVPWRSLHPTGPRAVRTESWVVIDGAREDPFADAGGPRRFPAQIWRPQRGPDGPVVVFLHGVKGRRTAYTSFLTELASHGYVAVAADHPPVALWPTFPESPGAPPSARWDALMATARNPGTFISHPTFALAHEVVEADVHALLRDLHDQFGIDTSRVMLMGHSFGGSVAVRMCDRLSSCRAVVNLDGPTFLEPDGVPLERPLMVVAAARTRTSPVLGPLWAPLDALIGSARGPLHAYVLPDGGHLQLSDMGLLVRPGLVRAVMSEVHMGPSNVEDVLRAVGAVTVAFADRYLREQPAADPDAVASEHPVLSRR